MQITAFESKDKMVSCILKILFINIFTHFSSHTNGIQLAGMPYVDKTHIITLRYKMISKFDDTLLSFDSKAIKCKRNFYDRGNI